MELQFSFRKIFYTSKYKNDEVYNWCCFKAQQAAEYAVKGLLYGFGIMAYGHSVMNLVGRVKDKTNNRFREDRGKEMDVIPYYEDIMEYVERVKMKLKPKLLVIFGSIAKGDFGVGSDVDNQFKVRVLSMKLL